VPSGDSLRGGASCPSWGRKRSAPEGRQAAPTPGPSAGPFAASQAREVIPREAASPPAGPRGSEAGRPGESGPVTTTGPEKAEVLLPGSVAVAVTVSPGGTSAATSAVKVAC